MKTKIAVTELHIEKGTRIVSTLCPVALAINEVLNNSARSGVCKDYFTIYDVLKDKEGDAIYFLNPLVTEAIDSFDAGKKMLPLEFEVDIPEEYLKVVSSV